MPFADPALHEKKPPPVAELATFNMAEGLELLAQAGRGVPPRTTRPSPLAIDTPTMARINKALDDEAGKRFQIAFDKCEPAQKVEILKALLEAGGGSFGLNYDRRMDQKPQTVMEFLASGSGNCADFSRLLVAVAKEKGLPVQMVSITFQTQGGAREEEQHLAVFNTGDKIYY
ncbi:transglutaminase domain-containing protein [Candidatus Micrarchaeota archaeon]|nr:transglutaminase domain-containing protein [Candidatus Micrarchaeota archaeon]